MRSGSGSNGSGTGTRSEVVPAPADLVASPAEKGEVATCPQQQDADCPERRDPHGNADSQQQDADHKGKSSFQADMHSAILALCNKWDGR